MTHRRHNTIIASILLLTSCGGKTTPPEFDAGQTLDSGTPECSTAADCLVPEGPCFVCPEGDVSCPVAQCSAGTCVVVHDDCLEPACPARPSTGGAPCNSPLHCEYGFETCCGATYPSVVCDCVDYEFACYPTDACMMPPEACSDGGASGCSSSGDCVSPAGPCMMCGDGSYACPSAECVDSACVVSSPMCPPVDVDAGGAACMSDGDCAAAATCMMCPDGSCASAIALCDAGTCEINYYPPCP